ncbi:MAG TPA: hypothetical protein VMM78_03455 [Thermomicrobiales bacterium]|nr:hypothetical protein [Thermomicrobiales bacterium]
MPPEPSDRRALQERIQRALDAGDDDALAAALHSGTHHGRPGVNARTKRWVAARLRERDGPRSPDLLRAALRHATSHEPSLRSISCIALADCLPVDRAAVMQRALALAADSDWEVREWAAGIFGAALDSDFDAEYPALLALTAHADDRVRRAVALAAMAAADARKPERAQRLLALLEPLLADHSAYVRRNLGPFAIGAGLLAAYPDATHAALRDWARRDDAITRWNVAAACGSAAARRSPQPLLAVLDLLALDERRMVRSAARAARRSLDAG